jgi:PAS domain S-box-containing protein
MDRPGDGRRRRMPLAPVSIILGVVLLLVVVAATLGTRQLVRDQERRLLNERADEVATLLGAAFQTQGMALQNVGLVWSLTGPDEVATFTTMVGPLVQQPGTAAGIARLDGQTVTTVASVGSVAPVDHAALVAHTLQGTDLTGTVVSSGGKTWLILARPVTGATGLVAFYDSPISPTTPVARTAQSSFREIRGALYASTSADPAQLVFTSDASLPLRGDVVTRIVKIGGDSWLLVAGSSSPLAGSLAGRLQWLVLAGGLVGVALAVAVAETLARRRRYAEDLVVKRTRELGQREATLAALFSALPDALQIIDADGTIRMASSNMAGQLHGQPDDYVGRPVSELIHPDDLPRVTEAFQRVLEGETEHANVEYRARTASGDWMILDSQLARLPADDVHPAAIVAGTRDVTERTRLLEDLQLARVSAEEANRSKNEFLSRMSHELRTPLNAVLGFAQLLDMEATTDAERESAAHIIKAGHHLLALIDEVLDIARIETGHLPLSVEPVNMSEVISEVLALTRSIAAERHIQLPTEAAQGCGCFVRADRQRLKQVLLNLVVNAIKYNRDGGAVVLGCDQSANSRIQVTVTDTGAGIDAASLERLFTPFERLGAEQSAVEGTGLGLALSKRLVDAMGGAIGVRSQPGHGSSFWIELDVTPSPVVETPAVVVAPVPEPDGNRRTVLYIEDNLSNVQLVERIVERRPNVELLVAMQGQLGLELARQHQPDLVLVDLNLPDLDGETVLRRLRAEPRMRDIPVVVLSADATPGQIARLRAAGAADYLTKPFDVPRFLRLVDGLGIDAAQQDGAADETVVESLGSAPA